MNLKHLLTYSFSLVSKPLILFVLCLFVLVLTERIISKQKQSIDDTHHTVNQLPDKTQFFADSIINKLSIDEKLAQLFIIALEEKSNIYNEEISKTQPGGILAGKIHSPVSWINMLNQFQAELKIPAFVVSESPFGFNSTGDSIISFGSEIPLTGIKDENVVRDIVKGSIRQMKTLGFNINVLSCNLTDVLIDDFNCKLPLMDLISKILLYHNDFKKNNLLLCVKGSSNFKMPDDGNRTKRNDCNLFVRYLPSDLPAVMPGHLSQINEGPEFKHSFFENLIIYNSLRNRLNYKGMVISDIQFQNISNLSLAEGEAELLALGNGSDMVITRGDLQKKINYIKSKPHLLNEEIINSKVRKVLIAKYRSGLTKWEYLNTEGARSVLVSPVNNVIAYNAALHSMVLLNNVGRVLPYIEISDSKTACVIIGQTADAGEFTSTLALYSDVKLFKLPCASKAVDFERMAVQLKSFDKVIAAYFPCSLKNENNYFVKQTALFLKTIGVKSNTVYCHFAQFDSSLCLKEIPSVIIANSKDKLNQSLAAQAVFGGAVLKGQLPFNFNQNNCYGDYASSPQKIRLGYSPPEVNKINSFTLLKIDTLINEAIKAGAFPGCQVFASHKGDVLINKSYGFHTYDKKTKVENSHLYDIASITKIAAGSIAIMLLYEKGKVLLDTTLNYYFNDLDRNSKGSKVRRSQLNFVTLRDIMIHKSGLPAGLPIYRFIFPAKFARLKKFENDSSAAEFDFDLPNHNATLSNIAADTLFQYYFSYNKSKNYSIEVAANLFAGEIVADTLWQMTKAVRLKPGKPYIYSDMNFYIVMKVAEKISGKKFDVLLADNIYKPLNLNSFCFNPHLKFDKDVIVPTENDKSFRKQLLQGYVHDPTAALLGGVSANAGLFCNAKDLGVLMQMLLNGGKYGGAHFFSEKTIRLFTSAQNGFFRGLGFNRQSASGNSMIAPGASISTYGHTGFTGTCAWVDPENEIVFVFLSNRVHPDASNGKILRLAVRQKAQQLIYEALNDYRIAYEAKQYKPLTLNN